tara:strand:- start:2556 stop:2951 length:396 start_codon:yes stop_codon:yes gene_type:complete
VSKIIDPRKEAAEEPKGPFDPQNLVIVCASPAYGYIGVGDFHAGKPLRLQNAVALVPVQVRSHLTQPGASPTQDTALTPIIGGKSGAVAWLHLAGGLPWYRVVDTHELDRNTLYGAYLDMTQDAWSAPTDA